MSPSTIIPPGSLVLVTAANSWLASRIVDELLQLGYRVRGTARSADKTAWLKTFFDAKYGPGKLETLVIKDIAVPEACAEAVKGVSGIVHVAHDLSFNPDPNVVIPPSTTSMFNLLDAATKVPDLRRFVYCSSSGAVATPTYDREVRLDVDTWNDESVAKAWAPPPYTPERGPEVYFASKVAAEKALWKFVEERKPHFVCNACQPNGILGPLLAPDQPNLSAVGQILDLFEKDNGVTNFFTPQYYIDVRDTARLHIAGLIDEDIKSERVFGYAGTFNWAQILAAMKKGRPDATIYGKDSGHADDKSVIMPHARSKQILQKNFGCSDFVGLEETIVGMVTSRWPTS